APRPVAGAGDPSDPAGVRPSPGVRAVLDLRLRLLGAPDVRRALARAVPASGEADRRRPARHRLDPRAHAEAAPTRPVAPARAETRGGVDPRAAGGGRI